MSPTSNSRRPKPKVSGLRPDGTELAMEFMGKGALRRGGRLRWVVVFPTATLFEDATLVRFNAEKIAEAIRTPRAALSLLRLISVKQRIATCGSPIRAAPRRC